MTNKEWLDYLAHNAPDELAAWFDAEHTESPTSETMQQIGQVIESTVKRGVYGDTESENADSRERLEADVLHHVEDIRNKSGWTGVCANYGTVIEWLDRQAAITEQEVEHDLMKAGRMAVEVERERIKKLNSRADYHGYEQAAIEAWESIKAWNSRAERTCEWELEHSGTLYDKWRCSKCGYLFVEPRCDQGYTDLEPNYCPNCGRKCI